MKASKACAVVLRDASAEYSILAFRHPLAGCQLVKGTIEVSESPQQAAVRELLEEAGVAAVAFSELGTWDSEFENQVWSFQVCRPSTQLPDTWTYRCTDDGGLDFAFFWQPLEQQPNLEWHPVHARAFTFVRSVLTIRSRDDVAEATRP